MESPTCNSSQNQTPYLKTFPTPLQFGCHMQILLHPSLGKLRFWQKLPESLLLHLNMEQKGSRCTDCSFTRKSLILSTDRKFYLIFFSKLQIVRRIGHPLLLLMRR